MQRSKPCHVIYLAIDDNPDILWIAMLHNFGHLYLARHVFPGTTVMFAQGNLLSDISSAPDPACYVLPHSRLLWSDARSERFRRSANDAPKPKHLCHLKHRYEMIVRYPSGPCLVCLLSISSILVSCFCNIVCYLFSHNQEFPLTQNHHGGSSEIYNHPFLFFQCSFPRERRI